MIPPQCSIGPKRPVFSPDGRPGPRRSCRARRPRSARRPRRLRRRARPARRAGRGPAAGRRAPAPRSPRRRGRDDLGEGVGPAWRPFRAAWGAAGAPDRSRRRDPSGRMRQGRGPDLRQEEARRELREGDGGRRSGQGGLGRHRRMERPPFDRGGGHRGGRNYGGRNHGGGNRRRRRGRLTAEQRGGTQNERRHDGRQEGEREAAGSPAVQGREGVWLRHPVPRTSTTCTTATEVSGLCGGSWTVSFPLRCSTPAPGGNSGGGPGGRWGEGMRLALRPRRRQASRP